MSVTTSNPTLSREILKWIQYLNLSYSVKNIKRDFSNGFLIAEMISRYHVTEIQMHSYSQGSSLSARKDNWSLLQNYFQRHSLPITKAMIDDIINYKTGAAIPIIHILYKHLTDREIVEKKPINPPALAELPSFARPTQAHKAKDDGRSTYISSFGLTSKKDPLELPGNKRLPAINPKASRSMLNSQQSGVVFKDVQVKSLDKNETRSRLQRSGAGNFFNSQQGDRSHTTSFASNGADSQHGALPPYSPQQRSLLKSLGGTGIGPLVDNYESIIDKLNLVVERELQSSDILSTLDEKKLLIASFIESVDTIEPQYTQRVFNAIREMLPLQATLLLTYPKEFSNLISQFAYGLKIPETSPNFEEFVAIFHTIGDSLMEKDQNSTWNLFEDYALFKLVPLIQTEILKRRHLLSIVYAFCANDPSVHMNVIKSLQEKLQNQHIFLNTLSHLSHLEEQFSPALLDIYMYYAVSGLTAASPRLRAASLSILYPLVDHALEACKDMIYSTFKPMLEDPWWEIKAQIIRVSSKVLSHISKDDPHSQDIYQILEEILLSPVTPHVYTIALSYLAPILTMHPYLATIYTKVLVENISEQERLNLLEQDPDHLESLQIGGSCIYDIVSLPFSWDSLLIAESLIDIVEREEADQFSISHYDVLEACINMAQVDIQEHTVSSSKWTAVFERAKSFLFAGLLAEESSEFASNLLLQFMKTLGEDSLKIAMAGIMKVTDIAFQKDSSLVQDILTGFLICLYDLGGNFAHSMAKYAARLSETYNLSSSQRDTPLRDFILHVQNVQ